MNSVINFLNEYGLLSALITGLFSALGVLLKKVYDKTIGERLKYQVKHEVAALVVKYVEQVYKDLHGEEKLEKALEAAADMLNEKGIIISDLELRVLLEAALAELNNAFQKTAEPIEEADLLEGEVEVDLPVDGEGIAVG